MPDDWVPMGEPAALRDPVSFDPTAPTMFNYADKGVGVINVPTAWLGKIPFVGGLIDAEEETTAVGFINNAARSLNRAFATSPRFAEGERTQIQKEVDALAKLVDRPVAFRQRLIALDIVLRQLRDGAYKEAYLNPDLAPDDIANARLKLEEIAQARMLLGAPPSVYTEEERDSLPVGSYYLWQGNRMAQRKDGGR